MLPPPRDLPEAAPRLADGRYVLMARIGRGGMAGVYAAWDLGTEEWRAVKVLLPKHARDKGLRVRFEREGETMKSLRHPNLVRVYDVGSGEKLPFLVMELINAGSLYRWTKTLGGMPPRMAVEAMIQLCEGLSAVHAAGVVHRDIKPRNVLINWDAVLKLTDFGIAQLGTSQETRTGLAMGTLGFMSPEQLHDSKAVDLRTDIYAVGATLWSQLTARKARDLFRLEDKPELMDGVPQPIQPLLARCLAYERADRYASAKALATALVTVLEQLPEDPPESPPLPLNLSLSFKSKPENTFSEILTTMHPEEEDGSSEDAGYSESPPFGVPRRSGGTPRPASRRSLTSSPPPRSRASLPPAELRSDRPEPDRRDEGRRSNPPSVVRAPPTGRNGADSVPPHARYEGRDRPSRPPDELEARAQTPSSPPPDTDPRSMPTGTGRSLVGYRLPELDPPPPDVLQRAPANRSPAQAAGDAEVPSYLVGVQQTTDFRRAEFISVPDEPKLEAPLPGGVPRWLPRVLLTLILAPVAVVAGALVVLVLVVGVGTVQVRSANSELGREQEELSNQVESESALRIDLLGLGADTGPIEQAFARWTQTTTEPDRSDAALEYLMLAEQESQKRIALSNRSHEEALINQRLDRLAKARAELLAAEEGWKAAGDSPQGRLAITLRLAPPAPPTFGSP